MKEFWIHLGAQVAMAAGAAIVCTLSHTDYSSLGTAGPLLQAGAAIAAETWNQFFPAAKA
jgi:hypothetical protein